MEDVNITNMAQRRETEKNTLELNAAQDAQPQLNHEVTGETQVNLSSTKQLAWILQIHLACCYGLDLGWPQSRMY